MKPSRQSGFYFTLLALLIWANVGFSQTKLLRFPDIHEQKVAFCYAGDLWQANVSGGLATRLTAHEGQEVFPRFSPDGKWIAFTGQYDGDEQVYVIPSSGGSPKQLTYFPASGPLAPRWGYDHQVYGWTPDGKSILFRSLRDANGGKVETALYTVPITGGLPTKLPMPTSGAGDFSGNGQQICYSPLFRDFRSWKRYEGGWAQDLYIFDLQSHDAEKIAASKRSERDPMWIGDEIYFTSDRDGTLNLYAYSTSAKTVVQKTSSASWDVRWPSSDNKGQIVYELNGELEIYNVASGAAKKISIDVPDDGLAMRPSRYSAAKNIEDYDLSPKGKRALFAARGDIFTVPVEKGPTRNLTNSSNAHDKHPSWAPDGSQIAFISDMSGEEQLYLIAQDGSGKPKQLTNSFKAMLYTPRWSPDGSRIALSDKNGKLYVITVSSKTVSEVADDEFDGIFDYTWSPNGGYLAFSMDDRSGIPGFSSLYIWSVSRDKTLRITDPTFNENEPVWDPNGKYLFYLSAREFAPQISNLEWNYAGNRETGIFALALRKDVAAPFPPESDEVSVEAADDKKEDAKKDSDKKDAKTKAEYIKVDFAGLDKRVAPTPMKADNIGALSAIDGHLIYVKYSAFFYGRESNAKPALMIFSMKDRKASKLVGDISGYALSSDGKKVLISQKGNYSLYDAKPKAKDKKSVSTKSMTLDRVPSQEWRQIFDEVWRRYRDFFYVKNMHGYDWEAIGKQYRELLPHVAHRSDLNYVISEMIGELNVGHAYIESGDFTIPKRPKVGLPGARFELDGKANRYRIKKIFSGNNEESKYRAPLTEIGVDAKVGDYVMSIDGVELQGNDNPYRLLQHKTDPVTLHLNSKPQFEGARKVTYKPLSGDRNLRYLEWITENRQRVAKMSDNRVGYLHLPNMAGDGIYEFIKWYYPQIRKEGIIVDVRSNGGGNVSQMIIERLDSKLLGTRFGNSNDKPRTYPYTVFHGHLVCLINETSASDGDIFPQRFRDSDLGPLIGKRTWGGVVGISGTGPLLDGGSVRVPLQGTNDVNGNWIIEGHGVDPDIEIANDPKSVLEGRDPQLERGVKEILEMIKKDPKKLPARPADPVKTK